jgi:hypothetical protein
VYARNYFARSELFAINDRDPFEVAGQLLSEEPVSFNREICGEMPILRELSSGAVESSADSGESPLGLSRLALAHATLIHAVVVRDLASSLQTFGLKPYFNKHVDLAVVDGDQTILFEVKTCNEKNLAEQVRSAVGQLLEYRYRIAAGTDAARSIRLVAVLQGVNDTRLQAFAYRFLASIGIEVVWWLGSDRGFDGLGALLGRGATYIGWSKTASAIARRSPT